MKWAGSNPDDFSPGYRFKRLRRDGNRWSVLTLAIVLFLALPVLFIGVELFAGPGETWPHIVEHLLADYIGNSLFLIAACGVLVFVLGVSTAWLVSRYEFPGRRHFEWLLILPLAIPSYIVGYAYAGIFDYGGSLELILRFFGLAPFRIDVMNRFGLAFVLAISLFPYVYVSARAFFVYQANNLLEASKVLGAGEGRSFFRLILPLGRPAIVAGMVLVMMEVLNDYGTAAYYGVSTFTTGIFRSWFSLEEPHTAVYLSAVLLALIFLLISLEKWLRREIRFSTARGNAPPLVRKKPGKYARTALSAAVFTPVLLGFILPLAQLVYWAFLTADRVFDASLISLSVQSFAIAFGAALLTVALAVMLIYFSKWNVLASVRGAARIGVLGYAIPGAVIAIGIMLPTLALDKWMIGVAKRLWDMDVGLLINGSVAALLYAYCVRFLAVAYNPVEATTEKVSDAIPDSSKVLGVGRLRTLLRIEFPLIKTGLISAVILVFVDVLKELPLTLILKPHHVNTLAVKAYEYASDEMVMESAIPSLFIIFTAMLPIVLLNRMSRVEA